MKNKDSSTYKMILLGIVCAVCGLLLSVANSLTAPVIAENKIAAIKSSLQEFYPDSDFEDVTDKYLAQDETGLIDNVYATTDNSGYIFKCHGIGYNSNGLTFLIGFNTDGSVSGFKALEQNETNGVGSKYFADDNVKKVESIKIGDDILMISGATLTSTAVKNGILAAEDLFNKING